MMKIDTRRRIPNPSVLGGPHLKSGGWRGHIGDTIKCLRERLAQSNVAGRIARNPQNLGANSGSIGPIKVLELIEPINSRMVNSEVPQKRRSGDERASALGQTLTSHNRTVWQYCSQKVRALE